MKIGPTASFDGLPERGGAAPAEGVGGAGESSCCSKFCAAATALMLAMGVQVRKACYTEQGAN